MVYFGPIIFMTMMQLSKIAEGSGQLLLSALFKVIGFIALLWGGISYYILYKSVSEIAKTINSISQEREKKTHEIIQQIVQLGNYMRDKNKEK